MAISSPSTSANNSEYKYNINLLQPELLPKKELLTLPRVVATWCVLLGVMIAWTMITHYSQQSLVAQLSVLKEENSTYTNQLEILTTQLAARKVDSQLEEKLSTVKLLMNNRQALHAKLTNPNKTYVAGFSVAMDELAQLHHQDIRLESININNDDMTFSGLALSPEAVPAWLARFENSVLLSGKSFSHFKLAENERNITEFMVSSKINGVTIHE